MHVKVFSLLVLVCLPSILATAQTALVAEQVRHNNHNTSRLVRSATPTPQPTEEPTETVVETAPSNHTRSNQTTYPTPPRAERPIRLVPVDFSLCPNSCNGRGADCIPSLQIGGQALCVCKPGYDGDSCELFVGCSQQNSCTGRGKCKCGHDECMCDCNPGWMGDDCSTAVGSQCPNHCSGRGVCRFPEFKCECDVGFDGVDCSRVTLPSPCDNACSGQGSCNAHTKKCTCQPGFDSVDCSTATDTCGGCRHGKCHNGFCICQGGFSGPHCEQYVPSQDVCGASGFCSGHGVCLTNGSCSCQDGFIGLSCEALAEETPTRGCISHCNGHGKCDALLSECVCAIGFGGPGCSEPLCPTVNGSVCGARGVCVAVADAVADAVACQCDPCFGGVDCSENALEQCPNICNEHGTCVCTKSQNGTTTGTCDCEEGWEGEGCQAQVTATNNTDCCPSDCSGNGECSSCLCVCFDGYQGDDCATVNRTGIALVEEEDSVDQLGLLLQVGEGKGDSGFGVHSMAKLWD